MQYPTATKGKGQKAESVKAGAKPQGQSNRREEWLRRCSSNHSYEAAWVRLTGPESIDDVNNEGVAKEAAQPQIRGQLKVQSSKDRRRVGPQG